MPGKSNRKQEPHNLSIDRRKVLKGVGFVGGATTVPGAVQATAATDGTRQSEGIETNVITDEQGYTLYRTVSDDRESVAKFYTDGPKRGQLEIANLSETEQVDIEASEDVSSSKSVGLNAIETQGIEIVERSKNVQRELDKCDQNYCDGFTYTHVQTGFSVEFVDWVDTLGKNVIAEAVAVLADIYLKTKWARWVSGLAGIVAGTILSVATGKAYTVSPWDQDKGWVFRNPVVELGVANGWDVHAHNLTNIQDNERAHIGQLDGRCG